MALKYKFDCILFTPFLKNCSSHFHYEKCTFNYTPVYTMLYRQDMTYIPIYIWYQNNHDLQIKSSKLSRCIKLHIIQVLSPPLNFLCNLLWITTRFISIDWNEAYCDFLLEIPITSIYLYLSVTFLVQTLYIYWCWSTIQHDR